MADNTSVDDLIRSQIPTWNQLFQQESQCECNECESMIGAPAYLANILHFAETCKPNDNGETPYDVLIKRAPYLPFLPLTCENTNTEIPYIQVVLEILEFYAAKKTIANMPAYDSGIFDWESAYLETSRNAYKILSTQCFPFSLPYHQPLDAIRTYLLKSKTSFVELISVFNAVNANIDLRVIKEYMALSDEEYSLLTEFKIGDDLFDVFRLYGFDNIADFQTTIFGDHGVSEFLQRTGLLYTELIDLLKTEFINPGINSVNFLENLFLGGGIDGQVLFTALKDIKNTPQDDAGLSAKVQDLLNKSNKASLNVSAFKKYMDENFEAFQQTMVIIPDLGTSDKPGDPCNFTNSKLGTILSSNDATIVNPIDDVTFKRLYFFIRLLKKTGLQIAELDTLLNSISGKGNNSIIFSLAYYKMLKEKFDLTAAQFVCLANNTNPNKPDSIYAQLFLNNSFKNINSDFTADDFGTLFSKSVTLKANSKYNNLLLAALRLSNEEMDYLISYLSINDPNTFNLSIESISVFYSYTLLSALLKIPLSVLLNLTTALGKTDALRTYDNVNSKFNDANLSSTKLLSDFVGTIANSGFATNEFLYVLGLNSNDLSFQIPMDKIRSMLVELQQDFNIIAQQNLLTADEDINENLVTNKLLALYNRDSVTQLIGMLNNKIIYGVTLTDKPDLNIPDSLKAKINYDKALGKLQVTGVLTLNDKNVFSADNNLTTALQPIWNKPFDFLKKNFSGFIVDDNTRNILLDRIDNETTSFEKLKTFYQLYQPDLIKRSGYNSIIDNISSLITLDKVVLTLIAKSVIDNLYTKALDITKEISTATDYFPDFKVQDFTDQLLTLNKSAVFISKFSLTPTEVNYFLNNAEDFENIDFINLNLLQWQQTKNYCFLRKLNRTPQLTFIDLFALASSGGSMQTIVNYIILLTGWQKDEISSIITTYTYDANSFKNASVLCLISDMFRVANKTSIKGSTLALWVKLDSEFDSLTSLSSQIKNEILQQFILAERSDANSKINSILLEHQRDALVGYILSLDEIKNYPITNVEELCGYFLIDIPMSSCMPTTRTRQAISTVQSFLKRCPMRLESVIDKATKKEVGVSANQIEMSVWEPKSFFRTWQVTMEFLTNPYPYLRYKYLIEKSEAAKTLEATLLKSDITQRTVEDAYRVYLQEMCETANLEIAAMYIDDSIDVDGNPSSKFIHVICKSRSAARKFYYCTKNESDRWSFLQDISTAIKENDGDGYEPSGSHLIFTKYRDRYYLFMPEFVKRNDQNNTNTSGKSAKTVSEEPINTIASPILYEIKIGVSEFFQGKWSKKTYLTLNGDWRLLNSLNNSKISEYIFSIQKNSDSSGNDGSLDMHLFFEHNYYLTFRFYSINSAILLYKQNPVKETQSGFYQNLKLDTWQLRVPNGDDDDFKNVLNKNDGGIFLNFSPQYLATPDINLNFNQPFFFFDYNKTYYATTEPFVYVESPTIQDELSQALQKSLFKATPTVTVLRRPEESIFLPLHIQNF